MVSLIFEDVQFEMSHMGDNMVIDSISKLGRNLKTHSDLIRHRMFESLLYHFIHLSTYV